MDLMVLTALGTLVVSLVIAHAFMKRSRAWLGVLLGLLPIGLMVWLGDRSLDASVQRCLDSVCESAGLPPGCGLPEFGCTEWSGLGYALVYLSGVVDLILYALGVIAIALVRRFRKPRPEAPAQPT